MRLTSQIARRITSGHVMEQFFEMASMHYSYLCLEICPKIIETYLIIQLVSYMESVKRRNSRYQAQISSRRVFHHAGMWFTSVEPYPPLA
jgi:hypothetical protein